MPLLPSKRRHDRAPESMIQGRFFVDTFAAPCAHADDSASFFERASLFEGKVLRGLRVPL